MLERARDDVELWLERGYGMVSVLDEEYPARLRDVREAPAILYYEGDLLTRACAWLGQGRPMRRLLKSLPMCLGRWWRQG